MNSGKSYKAIYAAAALAGLVTTTLHVAPILDDVEGTTDALRANGFTPVEVGGGVWFGGGQGDLWRTKFEAINVNGQQVQGYATSGLFKGTTLRFDND